MDMVYNDAASYGRFNASIGSLLFFIIGIGLLLWGVNMVVSKEKYAGDAKALVTKAECSENKHERTSEDGTRRTWTDHSCSLDVEFDAGKQHVAGQLNTVESFPIKEGQRVDVDYQLKDPEKFRRTPKLSQHQLGWVFTAVGAFCCFGSIVQYYMAHRFKFYAGATAVKSFID